MTCPKDSRNFRRRKVGKLLLLASNLPAGAAILILAVDPRGSLAPVYALLGLATILFAAGRHIARRKAMAWKKGKSRNLDPSRIAVARTLLDLLRRALDRPWRHPALGTLTQRAVADHLRVSPKTVHRWLHGEDLPPLWAVDTLRELLRSFSP